MPEAEVPNVPSSAPKTVDSPVPKAPKFAYLPNPMRPVSSAPFLDDEEPRPKEGPVPIVPKRPIRKRSLSTGDQEQVEEWRVQNNLPPPQTAVAKAVPPPKKAPYGM
mgnify:CR=1 FL=1